MCKVFPSFTLETKITAYVLPSVSTTRAVFLPPSAKGHGGQQKINYVLLRTPTVQKDYKSVNQDARGQAHPAPFFCVVFPPPPPKRFFLLLRLL